MTMWSDNMTVRATGSVSPLKAVILRWLSKGPRTFQDLVAAFGLPPTAIRRCLRELHNEGLVHVKTQPGAKHLRSYAVKSDESVVLQPAPIHSFHSLIRDDSMSQYWRSLNAAGMAPDDM